MTRTIRQYHRFGLSLALIIAGCFSTTALAADQALKAPSDSMPAYRETVSPEQIDKLINQLGDKDFYLRQQAQEELARLGFEAFDAVSNATTNDDLEIASRAKYLLRLMRVEWTAKNDPPKVKEYLQDYESQNAEDRQVRMRALAELPDGQGLPALCRLVRFEKTPLFSKMAAAEILGSAAAMKPLAPDMIDAIKKTLLGSKQPATAWILAWLQWASDPDGAAKEWERLVTAEQDSLRHATASGETRPEIVAALIRFQVGQLKQHGKTEEAVDAIRRLVALERGDADSLFKLLGWLIQEKAWAGIDDLAKRFEQQFAKEPNLLYALAQAYVEQGQKDRAEETSLAAFKLFPGKQPDALAHHRDTADRLRRQGLCAWARREYEYIIANSGPNDADGLTTRLFLAEMLHDQAQDLDAGKIMEDLIKTLGTRKGQGGLVEDAGLVPKEVRARMHLFFACHWERQKEWGKCRESLDKALKISDNDVDVLISCYRLQNQPPEYHAKICSLIKKTAKELRDQIVEDPEDATIYNQFAWLIGNTEGDYDEALTYSQKSVDLEPKTGGFYDTLARVYYAKGDLENAVKNQTRAIELEPHSGQMERQLDLFKKALEEKKKKS